MAHTTFSSPDLPARSRSRAELQERLKGTRLYVCTDARGDRGDLPGFLRQARDGGVEIIQLRDKTLDTDAELEALQVLAAVAAEGDLLFAVNDRADLAALVSADVFHIGQHDLSPQQARRLLGEDVLIGRSTHTIEQATAAMADPDVDYFCTGPVWATPTKPGRPATGTEFVAEVAQLRRTEISGHTKPWFAIGGIDQQRLPEVVTAGAERIVVVRAVTEAADPRAAAAALRSGLPA